MTAVAIGCAVLAAICAAFGAQLQHTGVRSATAGDALRLRTLGRLVRNRSWLLGFCALALGAVLQILALTMAPVTVVAPIVVLALPVVAVLNARAGQVRLDRAARFAIVASSLAVALFVGITAELAVETSVAPGALLDAARAVAIAVVALGVLAIISGGSLRCAAFAAAAGVAYGLLSVLVRDVGYAVRVDGFAAVPILSLFGLVLTFLVGSWLIQLGYSSGPPDVVVGFQTVLNPLVATVIGMTALGEISGIGAPTLAALITCGVVAVAGVGALARHHPDAKKQVRAAAGLRQGEHR